MKFTKLYTSKDNKSYFIEVDAGSETKQPIGCYSKKYPATVSCFATLRRALHLIGTTLLSINT